MRDPAYLTNALRDVGLSEIVGEVNEPRVLAMYEAVGHSWVKEDEVPWCAAYVGSHLKAEGYKLPPLPETLRARAYDERVGAPVSLAQARRGDVCRFKRPPPGSGNGHVGFFLSLSPDRRLIRLLSGNSRNMVREADYPVADLIGVIRPARVSPAAGGGTAIGTGIATGGGTAALDVPPALAAALGLAVAVGAFLAVRAARGRERRATRAAVVRKEAA